MGSLQWCLGMRVSHEDKLDQQQYSQSIVDLVGLVFPLPWFILMVWSSKQQGTVAQWR